MEMQVIVLASLLAATLHVACETPPEHQKERAGTVIGAVVGTAVGSQLGGGSGRTVAAYQGTHGPCREYMLEAYVDGKPEQVHGTACRQSEGSWKAQN